MQKNAQQRQKTMNIEANPRELAKKEKNLFVTFSVALCFFDVKPFTSKYF